MPDTIDYGANLSLRDVIDELENQIKHLERSQVELQAALSDEPDDEDFKQAVAENEEVIQRKQQNLEECKEELKTIDPAYYNEHYRAKRINRCIIAEHANIAATPSMNITVIDTTASEAQGSDNTNQTTISVANTGLYL